MIFEHQREPTRSTVESGILRVFAANLQRTTDGHRGVRCGQVDQAKNERCENRTVMEKRFYENTGYSCLLGLRNVFASEMFL